MKFTGMLYLDTRQATMRLTKGRGSRHSPYEVEVAVAPGHCCRGCGSRV